MTFCTDHIAWTPAPENGSRCYRRLVDDHGADWLAVWDGHALNARPVAGTGDTPAPLATAPTSLPERAPAELADALRSLGTVQRVANPSLWDALSTAIMRQVVRASTARRLYRTWSRLHGTPCEVDGGPTVYSAPGPRTILALPDEAFSSAGVKFFRPAIQAAAAAYLECAESWLQLDGEQLVKALQEVRRIGPWTAHTAVADYTGDFSLYPHDDLAVRTWADRVAPGAAPTAAADVFAQRWTSWADTPSQLHTLTLFTLTWGSHAPNRRSTPVPV